ncbi:Aste57867_17769 [Aphanomyces stellatus]|uniref:Phosphodiesterase n=1 Tax=Aphanomyces stellatus TaxID=120398 RepID=A0A485LC29_9STRA|nr:hypothetical protein As57867_017708 [Aphanomyces stellatus]VFT94515.1 Aste57867_17769 [Aphanomyces stellatus]
MVPSPRKVSAFRAMRAKSHVVTPIDTDVDALVGATSADVAKGVRQEDFRNWNFNVFVLETPPAQLEFVRALSIHFNLHDAFHLTEAEMDLFLADVQKGYDHVVTPVARQYHTFLHAVDVMQSVAVFLRGYNGSQYIQPISAAALLIAALCHDIGHIGLTNQYLVNSGHALTLEYRSPILESMHTAKAMALIKRHGFLKDLDIQDSYHISKTIARCILYTDVSIHSELLRKVRTLSFPSHGPGGCRASSSSSFPPLIDEASYVYCGFLLHAADICNPAKDWALATKWTNLIMSEFFEQGALERKGGFVVSAFRNADQINTAEIQANFVRLMLQPTLVLLSDLLPLAAPLLHIAEVNRLRWDAEAKQALNPVQVELVRELARPLSLRSLTPYQKWLDRMHKWLLSRYVVALVFLASLYATLVNSVRLAFVPHAADNVVGCVTLVVLFILVADVCISTCAVKKYRWSLQFWLDVISSTTLLAEIPFVNLDRSVPYSQSLSGSSHLVGLLTSKLFRGVRLLRMIALFKTFKEIVVRRMYKPRRCVAAARTADQPKAHPPDDDNVEGRGAPFTFTLDDFKRIFAADTLKITLQHIDQFVRQAYRGQPLPPLAIKNFCNRVAHARAFRSNRELPLATFHKILCELEADYDNDVQADNKISQLSLSASRLGEKVADATIRYVMFLLLALLTILTELNIQPNLSSNLYGLQSLHRHATDTDASYFAMSLQHYAKETQPLYVYLAGAANASVVNSVMARRSAAYLHPSDVTFLNTTTDCFVIYAPHVAARYRLEALRVLLYPTACTWTSTTTPCQSIAILDASASSQDEALQEFIQTLIVLACFVAGGAILTVDVYKRVIVPVDRMVSMTQQLALNPCKSVTIGNDESPMYEIALLQNTLSKVARLLQIGYGSAGAAIISKNMMGAEFDPIIPGKRVHAIFGLCDIRRFTDITECLQEQVMVFTNAIGGIVHYAAHHFNGHANRNVGDAFLLVWDISEDSPDVAVINQAKPPAHLAVKPGSDVDFLFFDEEGSKKMKQSTVWIATVADNALMAFLKTMVDVDNSPRLQSYSQNKSLLDRFDGSFQVRMGYGLHVGWAIDGAIGSKHKIDATYLSSDVNMASTLETMTKVYHVPLIMSHSFFNLLSPPLQQFCRCVDCVLFDGAEKPTSLYTCDYVNPTVKQFRGIMDLPDLQLGLAAGFLAVYDAAVDAYLRGDWPAAAAVLRNILTTMKPNDGPAEVLLAFMESHDFKAPADWPGYRKL